MNAPQLIKRAIVVALTIGVVWVLGIYISAQKTRRVAGEFYQWVHQNPRHDHGSYAEEISQTAPEFLERFSRCEEPFKHRVCVLVDGDQDQKVFPSLFVTTCSAYTSSGGALKEGFSPVSTHHVAFIRTRQEQEGQSNGTVVITVQTFLFGL